MLRILTIVLAFLIIGCVETPKRERFIIPEGFKGTVYVYYGEKEANPLPMEDGYRLIIVPPNGVVRTSSDLIPGKLHDEYWFYSDKGRSLLPPQKLGGGATVEKVNASGAKELYYYFHVL